MKQVLQKYRWLIFTFSLLLLVLSLWMNQAHELERAKLKQAVYENYQQDMQAQINLLIDEQKNAALALALMLAENPTLKTLLQAPCCTYQVGLKTMAERIEKNSNHRMIWIQAINREGISLERSWTERRGDSLLTIRKDLKDLLANPYTAPTTTVSTGLFTMSFKTMVPVFDKEALLGVVEIISQFQPLLERLDVAGGHSMVLADRRHRNKLIYPRSNLFIDDYYVVNQDGAPNAAQKVAAFGVERLVSSSSYLINNGHFVMSVPILDSVGQAEGYWVILRPLNQFDYAGVETVLKRFFSIGVIIIVMLILGGVLFLSRQQVSLQSNYYRNVIDSASDILYVTDLSRILDANTHFFELFNEFNSLEEFHRHYSCVCDTFAPGEGLLQREIDGVYWIQYILNRPGEVHKAKIVRADRSYFFAIKVQPLKQNLFGQYTVAMQDITEMENVQHQLAYLSQTDELTGIGNRLHFNRCLKQEISRVKRYQAELCILMFDIDFFKSINDGYGHDVGDRVLVELAQVVKANLRDTDIFCRYGGEEFIVLLLETGMEKANHVAGRVMLAVREHQFIDMPDQVVTCSFGLTCVQVTDEENAVLKRVDNALYKAKHNGRDCLVVD